MVSAGLCLTQSAHYWKPIQAGYAVPQSHQGEEVREHKRLGVEHSFILPETDNAFMSCFIPTEHIYPSAYTLKHPLSPNQAGQRENISIDMRHIKMPQTSASLVIEGAGGALVPLNDKENMSDLMVQLKAPVIVVARSGLGTLNHTFLTLFALRAKNIPILGVIMVGALHPDNKRDIEQQGKTSVLLELPWLEHLSPQTLQPYFPPKLI